MHSQLFLRSISLFFVMSLLSASAMAVESAPPFSISPILNGLNVAYFTHQNKFNLTLYVINHEKTTIICDAKYNSGPDKQSKHEESIDSEKGGRFKFTYGRHSTTISITLMCVKPKSDSASAETH